MALLRTVVYPRAATRGQDDLTVGQRAAANMFTLAMIYHNGKAGRCGEWMKAKSKTTKQRLFVEKSDFLIATDHKGGLLSRCWRQRRERCYDFTCLSQDKGNKSFSSRHRVLEQQDPRLLIT